MSNGYDISEDCILGRGKPSYYGYARVSIENKLHFAHRVAYEQVFGKIPDGYHIHHRCDNKMCINVNHLEALSPEDHKIIHTIPKSIERMASRDTCLNGHVFDGKNDRQRTCSICQKEIKKRWVMLNRNKSRKASREYKARVREGRKVLC